MTQMVEVQTIAGRRVVDAQGRVAGRIESIRAEKVGPKCVIDEYHLGIDAFLSRIGASTMHLFGFHPRSRLLRVPWRQLDLSDPAHPRLRCTLDELKAMQATLPPFEDGAPPKREIASE